MGRDLKKKAKNFWEDMNEEFEETIPFVGKIRKMTGIPEVISTVLILIYVMYQAFHGAYAEIFSILVGTIYPALKSIRAL